jgi:hypothetical protein
VPLQVTGDIYLLCFRKRLGTKTHSIKHYLGYADDLDARIQKHREGKGARVTQVLRERGIEFDVVAVWPGNRHIENELKLHSATRICPECTPGAKPPKIVRDVIAAEEKRRAREARKAARQIQETQRHAAAVAAWRAMSPYERGADQAEHWVRGQVDAGRTAEQIARANAYVTGPLRERIVASEKAAETFQGWSAVIAVELERLHEDQDAAARQQRELGEWSEAAARPSPSLASDPEREESMSGSQEREWLRRELAAAIQKVAGPDEVERLSHAEAAAAGSRSPVPEHDYGAGAEAAAGGTVPSWDSELTRAAEAEPEFEPEFEPPF